MRPTRRTLILGSLVSSTLLSLPAPPAQARQTGGGRTTSSGRLEAGAGAWKPWLLAAGSDLRLPPPPGTAATRAEIDTLEALVDQRDATALDRIQYWDTGAPGYRWNELATQRRTQQHLDVERLCEHALARMPDARGRNEGDRVERVAAQPARPERHGDRCGALGERIGARYGLDSEDLETFRNEEGVGPARARWVAFHPDRGPQRAGVEGVRREEREGQRQSGRAGREPGRRPASVGGA